MFAFMMPMFIAQVRTWPWRDEMANKHDLIMVSSLLVTLMIALALQTQHNKDAAYAAFLELLSTLCFVLAVVVCVGILGQFLFAEFRIQKAQPKKLDDDCGLPNLIGRASTKSTTDEKDQVTVNLEVDEALERAMKSAVASTSGRRLTHESTDDKVRDIYCTLNALSASGTEEGSNLFEIVKQLGEDLPTADLKKLQWGMGVIGYHVLGDVSKRPSGIVLAPATTRQSRKSSNGVSSGTLSETPNGQAAAVSV